MPLVLLNVADLVEDEVEDPLLQAAIAFDAVLGGWVGPRSPGTVLPLLYRLTGEGTGLPAARRLERISYGEMLELWRSEKVRLGIRLERERSGG